MVYGKFKIRVSHSLIPFLSNSTIKIFGFPHLQKDLGQPISPWVNYSLNYKVEIHDTNTPLWPSYPRILRILSCVPLYLKRTSSNAMHGQWRLGSQKFVGASRRVLPAGIKGQQERTSDVARGDKGFNECHGSIC